MTRVTLGWTSGAGRQPSRSSARPGRAVGVERAIELDLGVDPDMGDAAAADPSRSRAVRSASIQAPTASSVQSVAERAARGVGERPRHGSGPAEQDPRAEPAAVGHGSPRRAGSTSRWRP